MSKIIHITTIDELSSLNNIDEFQIDCRQIIIEPEKMFIIFRNLELNMDNITLILSNEQREQWLLEYVKTDILVNIPQLNQMWTKIIDDYLSDIITPFIQQNSLLLFEICQFMYSLIYFAFSCITNRDFCELAPYKSSTIHFGYNIFSLCSIIDKIEMKLTSAKFNINNYATFFIKEKFSHILKSVQKSKKFILLYGKTTNKWMLFSTLMSQLYKG